MKLKSNFYLSKGKPQLEALMSHFVLDINDMEREYISTKAKLEELELMIKFQYEQFEQAKYAYHLIKS